jgi:hypothetical protein
MYRFAIACSFFFATASFAQDKLESMLAAEIIGPKQTLSELQAYVDARIPRMPALTTGDRWLEDAEALRQRVLDEVVFRGEARKWRHNKVDVAWLESIPAGEGYTLKKLRYEALPGLWIPALLYEPAKKSDKIAVSLAVNGHDPNGKAAGYKQTRCINMAKRGMYVLNLEWLGMGQLRGPGYRHCAMNQLDLCGTSGLAPFYLAMARGLDVLLALPNADKERVAVSGLSGGGWQTIIISALDTRVTLSNPVAGYSSFRTRLKYFKDLGDSEQTPTDLARFVDYTHLTAMLAPRPLLLTYNSKDNCCFESGYALPPLLDAARPAFARLNALKKLDSHVNDDPGTHNFDKDNRQALYKMLGTHFFAGDATYKNDEIECAKEVKKIDELTVPLPEPNADFNTLAKSLMASLPRSGDLPQEKAAAMQWQSERRKELRADVKFAELPIQAVIAGKGEDGGTSVIRWRMKIGDAWSVPVVEISRGKSQGTTILLRDAGRNSPAMITKLVQAGQRVLAVDPFYFGECKFPSHQVLFALMLATVGERPLGLQAAQIAAITGWAKKEFGGETPSVVVDGPRLSVAALVACASAPGAFEKLRLINSFGSLKQLIEQNRTVDQMPELFCFGLLDVCDIRQLVAMAAPTPVQFVEPDSDDPFKGLSDWYALFGVKCAPLAGAK